MRATEQARSSRSNSPAKQAAASTITTQVKFALFAIGIFFGGFTMTLVVGVVLLTKAGVL
ncbi:MAG: hypothetical protein ACYCS8_18870 [Acidithiobacillus sp.]